MKERVNKEGKRYLAVTKAEAEQLPPGTRIYHLANGIRGIVPEDCKHEFVISAGIPRNIKSCKKCIFWEFTNELATPESE